MSDQATDPRSNDVSRPPFFRATALAGAGLIFGTAWIYYGGVSDGGILPKYVAVAAATLVATLIWLASDKGTGQLSTLDRWVVAFFAVTCLAFLGSTSVLRGGLELAKFAMLTSLYFAFSRLTHRDHLLIWTRCLAVALLVISGIGIGQYLNLAFLEWPTAGLPSATFSYRNMLAMYLVAGIPLMGVPFLFTRRVAEEVFIAFVTSAALLLLVYTRTRGSWVGLAGAVLLVSGCLVWRHRHFPVLALDLRFFTRRKALIAGISVICIALGAQIQPDEEKLGDPGEIPEGKSSVSAALLSIAQAQDSGRGTAFRNTLRMVGDHPIFGVGLMDWELEHPPYDKGEQMRPGRAWRRPHNDYLWFLAEYGIPAFLVYLAFLFSVALTAWRVVHRTEDFLLATVAIAGAIGFIALHTHALFSFPRERIGPYALAWFTMALIGSIDRERGEPVVGRRWACPLATVVAATIALTVGARAALGDHWNWTGYSYFLAQRPVEGESWAIRSAQLGVYDFQQLLRKSQIHQGAGHRPAAIADNLEVLKLHPNSMSARWNLANLHALSGNDAEAERFYRSLLELHPTYVPAYRDLAAVFHRMGRTQDAWRTCEEGLAISQTDRRLNYIYGLLHQANGNLTEALTRFQAAGDLDLALRERSRVAQTLGLTLEARTALEMLVEQNSNSAPDYFPLAALYLNTGLHRKALQAYGKFVELWPEEDDAKATARERIAHLKQILEKSEGDTP
jgi:O-antigen ligase